MELQDLNNLTNDIAISRLELASAEKEKEDILSSIPAIQELNEKIEKLKEEKEKKSNDLLSIMKDMALKSWKTEQATFSRASRKSYVFDPSIKMAIEARLKNGEKVENWEVVEKEYISIRLTPQKNGK